jgi:hypothetical protein
LGRGGVHSTDKNLRSFGRLDCENQIHAPPPLWSCDGRKYVQEHIFTGGIVAQLEAPRRLIHGCLQPFRSALPRHTRHICTVLDEFYRIAFRKKINLAINELQADLDVWLVQYNEQRPDQGCRWCFRKTPMQTFLDALPMAKEKLMAA